MKTLTIAAFILIGIVLGITGSVYARSETIYTRVLEIDSIQNNTFYKWVDPDNGNVCYSAYSRYGGISCVKP